MQCTHTYTDTLMHAYTYIDTQMAVPHVLTYVQAHTCILVGRHGLIKSSMADQQNIFGPPG